jgi:serine/threonine protein kinase
VSDENVGRVLGRKYELIRLLGRGGMGAVYEGRNQIGKRVAVKLLLEPELIRNADLIARFFREAQAAAAVESRHVVDVYDTGVDEELGFPFIIMAYLSGADLEHVVRRVGALNPVAAVRVASQAATGLAKAHEVGIVHRDVKPANLFLANDEGESIVKILDFGIAKLGVDGELASGDGAPLTKSGTLLGTPLYMSPEQAQGFKTIDARADVWSLGMCLYQALAGRLPFGDDVDTMGKVIVAVVTREIPPLSAFAPWVRPELAAVVHQALERDLEKRTPSARHFLAAMSPFLSGSLTVTAEVLVGVHETLGATLSVPPGAGSAPRVSESAPAVGSTRPLPSSKNGGPATTAGVASERGGAPVTKRAAPGRAVSLAVAGIVAVTAGVFGLGRLRATNGAGLSTTAGPSSQPTVAPTAASSATTDDSKAGVLTLRIPNGYTVKVDGFAPGSPESHGASRTLEDGKLELRGEFQTKFLVAVFDKSGKRVMVQDVYLYDNKLDPETIDTTVGTVTVDKPKRKAAPPTGAGDLPARF